MKKLATAIIVFLVITTLALPVYATEINEGYNSSDNTTFGAQADTYNKQVFQNEDLQPTTGFVGNFLTNLVPYLLIIGGLILLFQLIAGGFAIMTAVDEPKKADAGKQQITQALIGFLILFAAFWIAQALEVIFGLKFLGTP